MLANEHAGNHPVDGLLDTLGLMSIISASGMLKFMQEGRDELRLSFALREPDRGMFVVVASEKALR